MERPVKDGILYVQHTKFGKVKGGFGVGRGFALICHEAGPGAGPSASWEGATAARPIGAALAGTLGSAAPKVGLSRGAEGTHLCEHPLWLTMCWVLFVWSPRELMEE